MVEGLSSDSLLRIYTQRLIVLFEILFRMRHMPSGEMKEFTGFTLIELMIAISILALILVVGVPSFRVTIQNNRVITNANELISAVMIARNEAIKRGVNVQIMSNSGNSNWTTGWTIITDDNNDGVFNSSPAVSTCIPPADCLVHTRTGLNGGVGLNSVVNNVAFFEFDPRGRRRTVVSQPDTLVMCDVRGFVPQARAILITNTGRGRVVSATDPAADVNGNVNACT